MDDGDPPPPVKLPPPLFPQPADGKPMPVVNQIPDLFKSSLAIDVRYPLRCQIRACYWPRCNLSHVQSISRALEDERPSSSSRASAAPHPAIGLVPARRVVPPVRVSRAYK